VRLNTATRCKHYSQQPIRARTDRAADNMSSSSTGTWSYTDCVAPFPLSDDCSLNRSLGVYILFSIPFVGLSGFSTVACLVSWGFSTKDDSAFRETHLRPLHRWLLVIVVLFFAVVAGCIVAIAVFIIYPFVIISLGVFICSRPQCYRDCSSLFARCAAYCGWCFYCDKPRSIRPDESATAV